MLNYAYVHTSNFLYTVLEKKLKSIDDKPRVFKITTLSIYAIKSNSKVHDVCCW